MLADDEQGESYVARVEEKEDTGAVLFAGRLEAVSHLGK